MINYYIFNQFECKITKKIFTRQKKRNEIGVCRSFFLFYDSVGRVSVLCRVLGNAVVPTALVVLRE